MKKNDQLILEQVYQQITFNNQLHQQFLSEAGLLDKAKQVGSSIMNKAKSMFGSSVAGLLGIVQKADPQLFAKIQKAVQQKDEQTLQSIFKDPQIKQQQLTQESLIGEGVVDTIKGFYSKAYNFVAQKPDLAAKIALAGVLAAMTASGPDALNHIAGFLAEVGGKTLGGAAVGGAIGGVAGGITGGWEGAKKGFKKGTAIGAGVGLASGTQNVMAHGASGFDEIISSLASTASPEEAKQLASLKDKLANTKISPEDQQEIASVLQGNDDPLNVRIELASDIAKSGEDVENTKQIAASLNSLNPLKGSGDDSKSIANEVFAKAMEDLNKNKQETEKILKTIESNGEANKMFTKKLAELMKSFGL